MYICTAFTERCNVHVMRIVYVVGVHIIFFVGCTLRGMPFALQVFT